MYGILKYSTVPGARPTTRHDGLSAPWDPSVSKEPWNIIPPKWLSAFDEVRPATHALRVADRTAHHGTLGNNKAARRKRSTNTSMHMPMRRLAPGALN